MRFLYTDEADADARLRAEERTDLYVPDADAVRELEAADPETAVQTPPSSRPHGP